MRVERDGGDRRQVGPVETVAQNRCLSSRRPSTARGGEQREAALIHEDQRGLQVAGFFNAGPSVLRPVLDGFLIPLAGPTGQMSIYLCRSL